MDFTARLKSLRGQRGLRQKDVAEALGLTQRAIGNYESGIRTPDLVTLLRLANFFDVSLDYLTGRIDHAVEIKKAPLTPPEAEDKKAERDEPTARLAADHSNGRPLTPEEVENLRKMLRRELYKAKGLPPPEDE